MGNTIEKLFEQGQSIWCDNLGRRMLDSGELNRLIGLGVVGVTSNPTIFMKAITGSDDYDALIERFAAEGRDTMGVYEGLVIPDIADAAEQLRGVYERTDHLDGYVSLEVNPNLAYDTEGTIAEARRLFDQIDRPNVLIKVPATHEGIPAIEALIADGISVNVTLIFSIAMYEKVMRAYIDGLAECDRAGKEVASVASVASFFVSRVDSLVDKRLGELGAHGDGLAGQAAVANARLAYRRFEEVFAADGEFAPLVAKGARVQRPLWASTSTKNPDYSPTLYVDTVVGPHTVNTLPPPTIEAVLALDSVRVSVRDDLAEAEALFRRLAERGIHMDEVTDQLRREGVDSFAKSFDDLFANLNEKLVRIGAAR